MSARIVITGAGGQVGGFLAGEAARRGYRVTALRHADLDITDPAAVTARTADCDVVVNCAAFTNVDASESHPEAAHAANAVGPAVLARACADAGAGLVHLSTDYVFEGRPRPGDPRRPYEIDDPTAPLGVYGRSKLDGEKAVIAAHPGAHVVRTSWVYTGADGGTDFVAVMRKLAGTDRVIDVVDDQTGSPTYVKDLVASLLEILAGGVRPGILHAANAGAVSRWDQARAVFAELGADPARVRPISTAQSGRPAPRPVYSAMSMAGSAAAGLTPLRDWREALSEALAAEPAGGTAGGKAGPR